MGNRSKLIKRRRSSDAADRSLGQRAVNDGGWKRIIVKSNELAVLEMRGAPWHHPLYLARLGVEARCRVKRMIQFHSQWCLYSYELYRQNNNISII